MNFAILFSAISICAVAYPIEGEREEDARSKKPTFNKEAFFLHLINNLPEDVLLSNKLGLEKLCREATSELVEQLECLKLEEKVATEEDALLLKKLMLSQEFEGDTDDSNEVSDTENLARNDLLRQKRSVRIVKQTLQALEMLFQSSNMLLSLFSSARFKTAEE